MKNHNPKKSKNKQKNKKNTQKMKNHNPKKSKNKQKNKKKTKYKPNNLIGKFLGGKTRIYNQKRYNEYSVLGSYLYCY